MNAPGVPALRIVRADLNDAVHAHALVELLDGYARDAAGGGKPLSGSAKARLVPELARRPHAFSLLAFAGDEAVGLANCFEGFSTFAARPLVNVHDLAVAPAHRGLGIGAALLGAVEREARARGACKITLEVLAGNTRAWRLYERVGFAAYALDPAMGQAQLLQKWLPGDAGD